MTARVQGAAVRDKGAPESRATEKMVKVRRAVWLVLGMLSLSILLVVLGVYATTRTESLNVTGYASGVILTLGSFLGLLGLRLEENRKQLLIAAIVFLSFGIITSFLCLVIDGVCIVLNMDIRPLKEERCQYYSSGSSYIYENFYMSVSCWSPKESCTMTVRSGTCYCCDLYDCANGGYLSNYYEFVGVQSCEEVFVLYVLIWILASLNLVAFFAGILTTAVLGSIKDSVWQPCGRSLSELSIFPYSSTADGRQHSHRTAAPPRSIGVFPSSRKDSCYTEFSFLTDSPHGDQPASFCPADQPAALQSPRPPGLSSTSADQQLCTRKRSKILRTERDV